MRNLRLSPDHAVFVDGVLIPVRYLINGRTIVQERVDQVTYYHVELPAHDVIIAEGLPCETYLDTGNRSAFANGGTGVALHPDFARRVWHEQGCAELVLAGPRLAEARRDVLARAEVLGHHLTRAARLAITNDGYALAPTINGNTWQVRIPPSASRLRLLSRTWVPSETRPEEDDTRTLGVALTDIRFDGRRIALGDSRLSSGWHAPEAEWRWTNGDAGIALAGVSTISFGLALTGTYWEEHPRRRRLKRA